MLQERDKNQLDYKLCSVSIIMHTFFSILENFWLVWVPLLKILCVHIGTGLYRQGMLYCLLSWSNEVIFSLTLHYQGADYVRQAYCERHLWTGFAIFVCWFTGSKFQVNLTSLDSSYYSLKVWYLKFLWFGIPNWRSFIFREIVFYIIQYEI